MSPGRELAIACRCQLLTGSYDESTRSCTCVAPICCYLSCDRREDLVNHPKVQEAMKRNLDEYYGKR